MDNLPECDICINMALYLHKCVEWNNEHDMYISSINKTERTNKIELINEMSMFGDKYFMGCLEEFQWLYNVEQDIIVKKAIKKCINNIKSQRK
jgi:NADH:ubiquinone oxidoreductase subunit D